MKTTVNISRLPLILLGITALLITVTGILFRQTVLNILPLYVSLIISLLQSRVNRIAYLIGAGNSILYAVVYFHFRIYAPAAYALIFSCTIQLLTYFLWSRRPSGNATVFRAMKPWQRIALAVGFAAAWGILYAILSMMDSGYLILDNTVSLLGILVRLLTMLAFIEYVPLMILSQIVSIVLYLSMMRENPAQITYLIYILFSLCCQLIALKKVLNLYRQQNSSES